LRGTGRGGDLDNAAGVGGVFVVIGVNVVFSPTLSVGGTIDTFRYTCIIAWNRHYHDIKGQENGNELHLLVEKHHENQVLLLSLRTGCLLMERRRKNP